MITIGKEVNFNNSYKSLEFEKNCGEDQNSIRVKATEFELGENVLKLAQGNVFYNDKRIDYRCNACVACTTCRGCQKCVDPCFDCNGCFDCVGCQLCTGCVSCADCTTCNSCQNSCYSCTSYGCGTCNGGTICVSCQGPCNSCRSCYYGCTTCFNCDGGCNICTSCYSKQGSGGEGCKRNNQGCSGNCDSTTGGQCNWHTNKN